MTARLISLAGALDADSAIAPEVIADLLDAAPEPLSHGGRFTGRPVTRVAVGGGHVVKLRASALTTQVASSWVERVLARERELAVHHPAKTWFVAELDGELFTGNVTPELQALHTAPADMGRTRWTAALRGMWRLCLDTAARAGLKLDEGLSNFALDAAGRLYYVDDDLYDWDRFVGLAQSIGTLLRQIDWLADEDWKRLGEVLRRLARDAFDDPQATVALAGQIEQLLVADEAQTGRRDALLAGLYVARPGRRRPKLDAARPMALLADIHSNWPALEAVLEALKREGISQGLVLGDLVGYGPEPARCIEAVREAGLTVIKGNHDHAVATGYTSTGFSADARWVIEWTREQLDAATIGWLDRLPDSAREEDWLAVHGSPVDQYFLYGYVYDRTYEKNLDWLAERGIRICFHGHSHMFGVYYRHRGLDDRSRDAAQDLGRYSECLVCPGAVGQPRSGAPGAEYAIYEPATRRLVFHRLDYDIAATEAAMRAADFPERLGSRLHAGR